jgi:hypothetical protein
MSDQPLESVEPGTWDKIWDFLGTANLNSATGILKWIVILALGSIGLMWAGGKLLEGVGKALEAYKSSGLPLTLRRERRARIRQRQQFCKVLNGDLLTLAKAESWNDQYFTDLEAEVEAEGGYYPTIVHKMLGRRSSGLRRVPALISAIESSAEQALLLVGQPGSGKSVALRHLGHQFAERGIRSGDPKTIIPLYVNLRELGATFDGGVNADAIKQFVLDNIRRGDADTAAYVKQHWDEYRAEGTWFFLFDSFDEIPAVLHAPTGSTIIREYAEAIRQFFEGMSNCRGVLASREFKGPNELPWQKIRILPLSEERQAQLVDNSFLESGQKTIVSQHLASSSSSLKDNPLFLTLLCRYVKDHNAAPINDHGLLSGHIDRLARRDNDYTMRKYDLTPDQLIDGAVQIAILFAERPTLSLAPTQTEIASQLQDMPVPGGNLEGLLGALVDVKIGRSDVQEARAGDRRFAFSHRRYQETLFVRHLATKRDYLSPRELLTNTRWREYAVTLLQTQQPDVIEPILAEATTLLAEYAMTAAWVPILQEFGGHLAYYDWSNDPAVPLLTILQEGLARRLSDVPPTLSTTIEQLLGPRWKDGDAYDQMMVLQLGGLLPQQVLDQYLSYAVKHGGEAMEDIAFQRTVFLKNVPFQLAEWVRDRFSKETIKARKPVEILRLEALSARLPSSVGTQFILPRCQMLNKLRAPFHLLFNFIFLPMFVGIFFGVIYGEKKSLTNSIIFTNRTISIVFARRSSIILFMELIVAPAIFIVTGLSAFSREPTISSELLRFSLLLSEHRYLFGGLALVYVSLIVAILILYSQRSIGNQLNARYVVRRTREAIKGTPRTRGFGAILSAVANLLKRGLRLLIILVTPGVIGIGIMLLVGYRHFEATSLLITFTGSLLVAVYVFLGVKATIVFNDRRCFLTHLREQKRKGWKPSLTLQAQSAKELLYWLRTDDDLLGRNVATIRSLLRLLRFPPPNHANGLASGSPLLKLNVSESSMSGPVNSLLLRILLGVSEPPAKGGDIEID